MLNYLYNTKGEKSSIVHTRHAKKGGSPEEKSGEQRGTYRPSIAAPMMPASGPSFAISIRA